jgi:hypothetical protein
MKLIGIKLLVLSIFIFFMFSSQAKDEKFEFPNTESPLKPGVDYAYDSILLVVDLGKAEIISGDAWGLSENAKLGKIIGSVSSIGGGFYNQIAQKGTKNLQATTSIFKGYEFKSINNGNKSDMVKNIRQTLPIPANSNSLSSSNICGKLILRFVLQPPSGSSFPTKESEQKLLIQEAVNAMLGVTGFNIELPSLTSVNGVNPNSWLWPSGSNWTQDIVSPSGKSYMASGVNIAVLDTGVSQKVFGSGVISTSGSRSFLEPLVDLNKPNKQTMDTFMANSKIMTALLKSPQITEIANYLGLKVTGLTATQLADAFAKQIGAGHGTGIASIIGGTDGIAIGAKIIPEKVCDENNFWACSSEVVADAICYAASQSGGKRIADVINLSLGGYYPSPIVNAAVKDVIAKGVVVVTSAGNSRNKVFHGTSKENAPLYPAAFGINTNPQYSGLISVGAINKTLVYADFATFNAASLDLAAPGDAPKITSLNDVTQNANGVPVVDVNGKTEYVRGTSYSAAYVSAAAAILIKSYQEKHSGKYPKPADIQNYLTTGATLCSGKMCLNIDKALTKVP